MATGTRSSNTGGTAPPSPPSPPSVGDEHSTIEVLERELARAYRIERALRDVGLALGTTLDLDALLRLILERTTEALEAERATLYLLEQKPFGEPGEPIIGGGSIERGADGSVQRWETMLVSRVVEGGAIDEIALHIGEGIAGEVARSGRAANVRDAYTDPRFSRAWDERSGFRTRAVLCVPLRSQLGRTIGVIQVLNKRGGGVSDTGTWPSDFEEGGYFDEDDQALLTALATQAAVSIEQARLFVSILDKNRELSAARGALEKKVQDLNVLFAIERATARAGTREELALAILPEAARAVGARTAYVVLSDETGDLQLLYLEPDAQEVPPDSLAPPERHSRPSMPIPISVRGAVRKLRIKIGEGLVGASIARGETLIVPDVAADSRRSTRIRDALFPSGDDAGCPCAVVPLLDENDHAFGALAVLRRAGDRVFIDDDVDLLRLVALNASTGFQLESARETRALQERLSTIGSLLSGVMHDLKTPMTVISGYVQMIAETDDRAAREEIAEKVLKQFDHIGAMQREVLDFARGERTILVRRVYLGNFFGELEGQIRREIERRGGQGRGKIELVMDVRDRGIARFDEAKLTRALHNLSRNALEAMADRGGRLTLGADRASDGTLVITVADNGPGLPKEVEERLFESFVTAGKPSGTGLGLAIVKKIADDHRGTIETTSNSHGTKFVLRLPQPIETPALGRRPTQP